MLAHRDPAWWARLSVEWRKARTHREGKKRLEGSVRRRWLNRGFLLAQGAGFDARALSELQDAAPIVLAALCCLLCLEEAGGA